MAAAFSFLGAPAPYCCQTIKLGGAKWFNGTHKCVCTSARCRNAANYSYQTATDDAVPWTDFDLSSNTRVMLDALTPGKVYWARVRANGTTGPSEWSQPATAMAV